MSANSNVSPLSLALVLLCSPAFAPAQPPVSTGAQAAATGTQTAPPRQSGTVKAVTPTDFVLTTPSGQDVAVNLPGTVRILLVDPNSHDIKNAQPGTAADIAGGDKVIVTGTAGDTGPTLTATRVYVLKSGAIAAMHAQEQAAALRRTPSSDAMPGALSDLKTQ
jgi:hypothetical protein